MDRNAETARRPRLMPRLMAYLFVAASLALSGGPLALALGSEDFWRTLNPSGHVFIIYSAVTSGVTSALVSIFLCWRMAPRLKYVVGAHLLAGAVVGTIIGLVMIPLTVGSSFFFGPPSGVLGALAVLFVRIVSRRA